ncbi:TPA: YodC family protein [Providencia alcalifaciens]
MSKAKYKIGDKVKLNAGGPVMNVEVVHQRRDVHTGDLKFDGAYTCQWFAGKKLDSGKFPEASLDKVTD